MVRNCGLGALLEKSGRWRFAPARPPADGVPLATRGLSLKWRIESVAIVAVRGVPSARSYRSGSGSALSAWDGLDLPVASIERVDRSAMVYNIGSSGFRVADGVG